ncbi:MAG TPA: hypothetical protein VN181_04900 [Thermoanaerobaculia bacterium]|nr:hypothetical protein [Thermoanaerobaculia bacterium]
MLHVPRPVRFTILVALAVVSLIATFAFVPHFPQDPRYHEFAGPRAFVVWSNLGFLIVALLGFASMRTTASRLAPGDSIVPVWTFFIGILLTFFGSFWYHLEPDATRLIGDRAGIVVASAALIAIVFGERPLLMLAVFELLGILSVVDWYLRDDLRLYGYVQFFPAVLICVAFVLGFRYTRSWILLLVIAGYAVAKVCELKDREILAAAGVSGHTLKHVVAALATAGAWWWVVTREVSGPKDLIRRS